METFAATPPRFATNTHHKSYLFAQNLTVIGDSKFIHSMNLQQLQEIADVARIAGPGLRMVTMRDARSRAVAVFRFAWLAEAVRGLLAVAAPCLDRRASISIITAAVMPAIVGAGAIVIDFARASTQLQSLQTLADAAALAGALAYKNTSSTAAVQQTVQDVVVANGWSSSIIQSPGSEFLSQDPYSTSDMAVQVALTATSPLWFGQYILPASSLSMSVSALARISASQSACVLSLTTLMVNGTINVGTCAIVADSTGSPAATVNSGGSVTAGELGVGGTITNNGTINATQKTGVNIADPFASLQSQAAAGFNGSCPSVNTVTTLTPGCYSNVNVNSNSTLTLSAGVYYFNGLNVNSGATLDGSSGTALIIKNNFSPSGTIKVTAPTSGTWAGMALYLGGGMNINSGVQYYINGAVYSPATALNLNTASWNQNTCVYIVAYSITLNGGSTFTLPQSGCSSVYFPTSAGSYKISLGH
jgi:hypothetical protein